MRRTYSRFELLWWPDAGRWLRRIGPIHVGYGIGVRRALRLLYRGRHTGDPHAR